MNETTNPGTPDPICPFLMAACITNGSPLLVTNGMHTCQRSKCQLWGSTYTTENILVEDCRLVGRDWVREV